MGLTNLATQGSLTDFQPDSADIKARRCARMKHRRVISIDADTRKRKNSSIPTHTGAGVLPPWKPANPLLVDAG